MLNLFTFTTGNSHGLKEYTIYYCVQWHSTLSFIVFLVKGKKKFVKIPKILLLSREVNTTTV